MGIEKRLQLIMVSNRLTASSFADRIGVQRSNVSHVLNGRNKPGYDFLIKVVHAFPKVNTHWLLTGEENLEDQGSLTLKTESVSSESVQKNILNQEKGPEATISVDTTLNSKRIIKTIVFYDDFSFDAFLPSEK